MTLKTQRLVLRTWEDADVEFLYKYASSPEVGPNAGWTPHANIEESKASLRGVLSKPETYAIISKDAGHAIGSISLKIGKHSGLGISENEAEVGCWLGAPFWGQGLMPEAVEELMRHGFEDLGLKRIWYGHFAENTKSRRVREKCGFIYHHTIDEVFYPLINETKTKVVSCLKREEWERREKEKNI